MTLVGALLSLPASIAWAQSDPEGFPDPAVALVDEDFGVGTREFGLDRRVEMYQWHRGDVGFERVWNAARIDSTGFGKGHENPPTMPMESRLWWAPEPTLDGRPLDPAVLRTLGEWRVLHPSFSRLPANLAASFQPEGDGLGSAENPLAPQIGDLRINWRELVLPPLTGKVELRGGVWRLRAQPLATDHEEGDEVQQQRRRLLPLWPVFFGSMVVILAAARRRRRGKE
ncbi:TMEM43 family protein [Lysobacter fragariae]